MIGEPAPDTNTTPRRIASLVSEKQIYRRHPSISRSRAVRAELVGYMNATRCVYMATVEEYAELLMKCGHSVEIYVVNDNEMKKIRLKAAKHILHQCQRRNSILKDVVFQESTVNIDDISDDGRHHCRTFFVPSVSKTYVLNGRMATDVDAAHCNAVGPQPYGASFEDVTYDTNSHLLLIVMHTSSVQSALSTVRKCSFTAKSRRV